MATISIDVEELNILRESLQVAKFEAQKCAAIALILNGRLDEDENPEEFYLSYILVEGDSGFPAICEADKYLSRLQESVNEQTAQGASA